MQGVQKFFAGQVWQSQYGRPLRPQRDVDLKNYLPWKLWPSKYSCCLIVCIVLLIVLITLLIVVITVLLIFIFFVFLKGRDFPPVAIGPHYLMSSDCVAFLTKNKQVLRGVGTLEDVSISVWLRAYGVVRWFPCVRLPSRCTQSPVFCSFLPFSSFFFHCRYRNTSNGFQTPKILGVWKVWCRCLIYRSKQLH